MSLCRIEMFASDETVTFEAATVTDALAMKADYLFQTVGQAAPEPIEEKPSGFLSKVKGGTDA